MNWINILKKCHHQIRKQILPLIGTPEANKQYGKGAGGDTIKKIDLIAEKAIINTLKQQNISCTLISEESGIQKIGPHPQKNYITTDPIDGTTNAIHGIPFIATSIAISTKPQLKHIQTALVSDLIHNTIYTAQKQKGAYRNNKKIKPSNTTTIENAIIGIDLKIYKVKKYIPHITKLLEKTKHPRHFGANALELCYVADGTTDAFIDLGGKLRVTDIAAAYLILKEAGATITTPEGNELNTPLTPTQKVTFIAAANTQLHKKIKNYLISPQP